MVKSLIFDFDGVIIDTESTEFQTWQEVYREHGCELRLDVWVDCVGRPRDYFDPYAYLEKLSGTTLDRDYISKKRRARTHELNQARKILPGVENYIAHAKRSGLGLGVASSSDRNWVQGHLERLGLMRFFDVLICAEDTWLHKPEPAPYLAVVDRLQCHPYEALAFEDSPNGIMSAKTAGLFCVAVPNPVTRSLDMDMADILIDSLETLSLEQLIIEVMQRGGGSSRGPSGWRVE